MSLQYPERHKDEIKLSLNVSLKERERIERETRGQSSQQEWYTVRSKRITGSKCGKILILKRKSVYLLRQCLYPKPLDPAPAPIAWGRHHEPIAVHKYISQMTTMNHLGVSVENCGFIIHPEYGWLGASPDGIVRDPTSEQPCGIIEIKCPYSKREMTPQEACIDPSFYCKLVDSKVQYVSILHTLIIIKCNYNSMLVQTCTFGVISVYILAKAFLSSVFHRTVNGKKSTSLNLSHTLINIIIVPELICSKYKPGYIL